MGLFGTMIISNIKYFLNVFIFVDFTTNLATGKFAEMSSRQNSYYPAFAVDVSYRNHWYGRCAVTKKNTTGSWWKVDLDAVYDIKMVMILGQKHCCGETETLILCKIKFMVYILLCPVISITSEPVNIKEIRMQFSRKVVVPWMIFDMICK